MATSNAQKLAQAEQAIDTFLLAFPRILSPPGFPDLQFHGPGEIHGIVILPLWQQTAEFNTNCPHWPHFNTFLDGLAPLMKLITSRISDVLSNPNNLLPDQYAHYPNNFGKAIQAWNIRQSTVLAGQLIQPRILSNMNCFETVRLSAMLASDDPRRPSTSRSSDTVVITTVGDYLYGDMWRHAGDIYKTMDELITLPGKVEILNTRFGVQNNRFTGRRFQLEFFLPDISTV
ncbi:uncharacterized protein LY89DRAFT_757068 [Mollisia scopiformis]|uniref:Uncharacterized protein n=1 Tax=Mollisia scopiformis TaxID=149040 RepID=A0A194WY77_MOLSC|nr:uncharacterized protein LY89DRAFT_757068 [Mollisia scopiformis]KUJ12552.1 hypothetical protein LY89DRAFT_757068 [Mollisia scopiformis]